MTRSRLSKIGLWTVLIAAMFCMGWVTGRQPVTSGWEYQVFELHAPQSHAKSMLNQQGEYGWELVLVTQVPNSDAVYYYLKRAK